MGGKCPWAATTLLEAYHDREWGVPLRSPRGLFEFLILEGAQAGLSWETILRKREAYREAFDGFDAEAMARYSSRKVASLLENPGIVRNRLKVQSAIGNARAFLEAEASGGFAAMVWGFVQGRPIDGRRKAMGEIPFQTPESEAMSKALRARGFRFVGPTICYAFMQATGMVNDHLVTCPRHGAIRKLAAADRG